MQPPDDRPTPRHTPVPADPALPRLLGERLDSIDAALDDLKRQQNAANGELYRRLEQWTEDLRVKVARDIEDAIREHIASHHMNGDSHG